MFALLMGLASLASIVLWLHRGIANDQGSPDPAQPFPIEEPTVAQAIYGRLDAQKSTEYYMFSLNEPVGIRAIMLIPESDYVKGFRASFTLIGPGLPIGGLTPKAMANPLTIAGRAYMLTQSHVPPLPESGSYQITVRHEAESGAYCLCVGDQEGGHADAAMRERIERLLAGEELSTEQTLP